MEFYDESDLELIVARSANLLGVQLDSSEPRKLGVLAAHLES
jgi:Holliday junction resolvasome RuvABC ATP-dependent DNA helicase subunit